MLQIIYKTDKTQQNAQHEKQALFETGGAQNWNLWESNPPLSRLLMYVSAHSTPRAASLAIESQRKHLLSKCFKFDSSVLLIERHLLTKI